MDTNQAIKILGGQISEINILRQFRPYTSAHIRWFSDTLLFLEDIFGKNSQFYQALKEVGWEYEGSFEYTKGFHDSKVRLLNQRAYQQGLDIAQGLLESGIDLLKRKGIDAVYEGKNTPKETSEILKVESLIENSLRKAILKKPVKESDVSDELQTLFIGSGLDNEFTREKERIIYSSKTYIPDFVFKRISTIVEMKFCNRLGKDKEIIAEINDDIIAYKTAYNNLIFVVYDSGGVIRNADEFKGSIEKQESVVVKVIKH